MWFAGGMQEVVCGPLATVTYLKVKRSKINLSIPDRRFLFGNCLWERPKVTSD